MTSFQAEERDEPVGRQLRALFVVDDHEVVRQGLSQCLIAAPTSRLWPKPGPSLRRSITRASSSLTW